MMTQTLNDMCYLVNNNNCNIKSNSESHPLKKIYLISIEEFISQKDSC